MAAFQLVKYLLLVKSFAALFLNMPVHLNYVSEKPFWADNLSIIQSPFNPSQFVRFLNENNKI